MKHDGRHLTEKDRPGRLHTEQTVPRCALNSGTVYKYKDVCETYMQLSRYTFSCKETFKNAN